MEINITFSRVSSKQRYNGMDMSRSVRHVSSARKCQIDNARYTVVTQQESFLTGCAKRISQRTVPNYYDRPRYRHKTGSAPQLGCSTYPARI
jgi:hypothetical protein